MKSISIVIAVILFVIISIGSVTIFYHYYYTVQKESQKGAGSQSSTIVSSALKNVQIIHIEKKYITEEVEEPSYRFWSKEHGEYEEPYVCVKLYVKNLGSNIRLGVRNLNEKVKEQSCYALECLEYSNEPCTMTLKEKLELLKDPYKYEAWRGYWCYDFVLWHLCLGRCDYLADIYFERCLKNCSPNDIWCRWDCMKKSNEFGRKCKIELWDYCRKKYGECYLNLSGKNLRKNRDICLYKKEQIYKEVVEPLRVIKFRICAVGGQINMLEFFDANTNVTIFRYPLVP